MVSLQTKKEININKNYHTRSKRATAFFIDDI